MSTPQPPVLSPVGMKTQHWGIIMGIVMGLISALQTHSGQTVDLTSPTTWGMVISVIYTIYGFIRNPPQGTPITS